MVHVQVVAQLMQPRGGVLQAAQSTMTQHSNTQLEVFTLCPASTGTPAFDANGQRCAALLKTGLMAKKRSSELTPRVHPHLPEVAGHPHPAVLGAANVAHASPAA